MPKSLSFRIGKVTGYLRGQIWFLCYFEPASDAARALAPTETLPGNSPPKSTANSKPAPRPS